MDNFQAATDNFLKWFKSAGGEFRDDLIEIADLRSRGAGRGIIALKEIPEDYTLFSIPRDAILSVETCGLTRKIPGIFNAFPEDGDGDEENEGAGDTESIHEPLDPWASLILCLLYEHLQGSLSYWKPYLDILPTTFDTPLFWTDAQLAELKGTCLTSEKIGKEESDSMLRERVIPVVSANEEVFYPANTPRLGEEELLALAHQFGSTIMSYAFDLDPKGDDSDAEEEGEDGWIEDEDANNALGMVPMADVLNANAEFNAHINHAPTSLTALALRDDIKPGDEILNYYGPLPSSELLRRYGYVTPLHARYDVAEVSAVMVRDALVAELGVKKKEVEDAERELEDGEFEDAFIIERDSGVPDSGGRCVSQPAVLREVSPELTSQLGSVLKTLRKSKPQLKDKAARENTFKAVVRRALMAKIQGYSTSIDEDEALLRDQGVQGRQRMAVLIRLGEKKLLGEALGLLGGFEEEKEERPAKRARKV